MPLNKGQKVAPGYRLAFVRNIGEGNPGWNDPVWLMPGADPSTSTYDVPEAPGTDQSNLTRAVSNGVRRVRELMGPDEPTMTRDGRWSAQFSSVPAASFFQGYWSPRFSWLGSAFNPDIRHTPLHQDWNLTQPGTKEAMPATTYNPFPPGGALWPKAI